MSCFKTLITMILSAAHEMSARIKLSFHIMILFQNYLAMKTRPYSIIAKKADNIQTQTNFN